MTGDGGKAVRRRGVRERKLFRMSFDLFVAGGGLSLENEDLLVDPFSKILAAPPGRGFPKYPERPRFVVLKMKGRAPRDLELFNDYWLVSDRAKAVFQAVDADAFAFLACDVRFSKGVYEGPAYWLCDVTRVLDALDEARSRLKIAIGDDPKYTHFGKKYYSLALGDELVFKDEAIGNVHAFRMAYHEMVVICGEAMRDACKAAGLTGVRFRGLEI